MNLLRYGAIMPPMRLTEQVGYPTGYLSPWYEWTEVGERPLYYEGHWNGSAVVPLEQWDGTQTFSPERLPNLVAWYDPSDSATVTLDGNGKVSDLADKGPNGYHLTQANSTIRPSISAWPVTGIDSLEFNTDNTNELKSASFTAKAQPFAVASAVKFAGAVIAPRPFVRLNALTIMAAMDTSGSGSQRGWKMYGGSAYVPAIAGNLDTNPHVIVAHASGSASYLRNNGVLMETPGTNSGTNSAVYVQLTGQGSIGEVVWVAGALSAENQTLLETYMMTKWGIT